MSRVIARDGGTGPYRALEASEQAFQAALRPKRCLPGQNRRLRYAVERKLCHQCPPAQGSVGLTGHARVFDGFALDLVEQRSQCAGHDVRTLQHQLMPASPNDLETGRR